MALPTRCPRCAARRVEGLDTCPKCQWRYTIGPTPTPASPWAGPTVAPRLDEPKPADYWVRPKGAAQPPPTASTPTLVQLQPMDRRAMARWSYAALQVRCLGAMGGCLGVVVGAFVGTWVSAAATQNAFAVVPGLMFGAFIGMWVGIFMALRIVARD
jgi:hypothetical protein